MDIIQTITDQTKEILDVRITTSEELNLFREKFLGKDGLLKALSFEIKNIPAENRKDAGQMINQFKQLVESTYEAHKQTIDKAPKVIPFEKMGRRNKEQNPKSYEAPVWKTPAAEIKKDPIIPVAPLFGPSEKFWAMIDNKPVECHIGSVNIKHSINEFLITYDCYYSRSSMGIVVNGISDSGTITMKETQMFKTKELLLDTL